MKRKSKCYSQDLEIRVAVCHHHTVQWYQVVALSIMQDQELNRVGLQIVKTDYLAKHPEPTGHRLQNHSELPFKLRHSGASHTHTHTYILNAEQLALF